MRTHRTILEPDRLATKLADYGICCGDTTPEQLKWRKACVCAAALIMGDNYVRQVMVAGEYWDADDLLELADDLQFDIDAAEACAESEVSQ